MEDTEADRQPLILPPSLRARNDRRQPRGDWPHVGHISNIPFGEPPSPPRQRKPSALLAWKLDEFFDRYVAVSRATVERSRSDAKEFIRALQPKLDSNRYNLKFRSAIVLAGGCHGLPARRSVGDRSVVYLPLRVTRCRAKLAAPGYCHVALPKVPQPQQLQPPHHQSDRYAALRSAADARLLSPMAAYRVCHELISHHAQGMDAAGVDGRRVQVLPLVSNTSDCGEGTHHIVVVLASNNKLEIVPCILPRGSDGRGESVLVVAKPYCHDQHPDSDVLWRYCFRQSESALLRTVSTADGGVRVRSLAVLFALFERDAALSALGALALRSLVLSTVDRDVDESLTWQRDRQQDCVLAALEACYACVQRKFAPHFFISGFNVLGAAPDAALARVGRRLRRLLRNHNELLRLLETHSASTPSPPPPPGAVR